MTDPTTSTAALPSTVEFKPKDDVQVDPTDWAKRAAEVRASLATDGLAESDTFEALLAFRFTDAGGTNWSYNGTEWLTWSGQAWAAATPPAALTLQPFTLDLVPDAPDVSPVAGIGSAAEEPAAQPEPTHPTMQAASAPAVAAVVNPMPAVANPTPNVVNPTPAVVNPMPARAQPTPAVAKPMPAHVQPIPAHHPAAPARTAPAQPTPAAQPAYAPAQAAPAPAQPTPAAQPAYAPAQAAPAPPQAAPAPAQWAPAYRNQPRPCPRVRPT